MMKLIQDSTFDLLKNIDSDCYQEYSIKVALNTINLLKKHKYKSILFFLNGDIEPNILPVVEYCLKHHYECYYVSYLDQSSFVVNKITDLNFKYNYFLYTKMPISNSDDLYNDLTFDVFYVPILNFDKNKNYLDTHYQLVNNLLNDKIKANIKWGYSFSFQKYDDLSKYSNNKIDCIITNNYII